MGSVWKGVHATLGTRVAVKFIDAEHIENVEARNRFASEALAAARLRSKYVVDVYDHGVLNDGKPYIVMEYLDGEPLDRRLDRVGRLSLAETARIVGMVCRALSKAHAAGIVHRDVKPENIFLVWDEEDGTDIAKVLDFGIAKFTEASSLRDGATRTGSVLGTPYYMSPEQARGLKTVDYRADLWSVGVIAFRCLTGRLPFEGEAVGDLLVKLCTAPIPTPRELVPELPLALDAFIATALTREPIGRFQSAHALADSLAEACGADEISPLHSAPTPSEARRDGHDASVSPNRSESDTASSLPVQNWEVVSAAIPPDLAHHSVLVLRFIQALFSNATAVSGASNLVRLSGPRFPQDGGREFIAVFLGKGSHGRRVMTATFIGYVDPLKDFLNQLDPNGRKVIIAIVDSSELGAGVREKIFEFNRRYSATVLPFHVGDLSAASDDVSSRKLFNDRIADFHVFPDVFGTAQDSASLFGVRNATNLLVELLQGPNFIVLHGPPGSGKRSLVISIREEVSHTRFVRLRCVIGSTSVSAFIERLQRAVTREESTAQAFSLQSLREITVREAKRCQIEGQRLVLVLEDADRFIQALLDEANEERSQLRALWAMLGELVEQDGPAVSVVVTSVWGQMLKSSSLGGWTNPLASRVRSVELRTLAAVELQRMMRELGAQINVHFESGAVRAVHKHSAGNVSVARMICRALVMDRREAANGALEGLVIGSRDVKVTAKKLTESPSTFGEMVRCFTPVELKALCAIAVTRSGTTDAVRSALGADSTYVDCREVIERLQGAGFVAGIAPTRVAVPLFEAWIAKHLAPPAAHQRWKQNKPGITFLAGLFASGALIATYIVFTSDQSVSWRLGRCEYLLSAPQRATPGTEIDLRTVRKCSLDVDENKVVLVPGEKTFPRFSASGNRPVGATYLLGGGGADWLNDKATLYFEDMGQDVFSLRVQAHTSPPNVEVVIRKDWMGGVIAAVLKFVSLVPAVLGAALAFHKDVLDAVRRLKS